MLDKRKGYIYRIVETLGMGYIAEPENDRLWPFLFSQLNAYHGQDLETIGLAPRSPVSFLLQDGALVEVVSEKTLAHSGGN